ncbi:MAG: hypothetical protein GEV09_00295 [Pseudonocardiaceae bacterium]|nr:hypothetical protein [Pseudonocardiaceae bacterium]
MTSIPKALMDTSAVIDLLQGKVLSTTVDEVAVSAVTLGELHYGVAADLRHLERVLTVVDVK